MLREKKKKTFLVFKIVGITVLFFLIFYVLLVILVETTGYDDVLNVKRAAVVREVTEISDKSLEKIVNKDLVNYALGVNQEGKIVFKDTQKAFNTFKKDYRDFIMIFGWQNGVIYYSQKNWKDLSNQGFHTGASPFLESFDERIGEGLTFLRYYANSFGE